MTAKRADTTLPESRLRALRRLDYHKLGVVEMVVLSLISSPETDKERQDLFKRHPALKIHWRTPREKKIYDEAIHSGAPPLKPWIKLSRSRRQGTSGR